MIVAVFAFGADVDRLVKLGELCYGDQERGSRALAYRVRLFFLGHDL